MKPDIKEERTETSDCLEQMIMLKSFNFLFPSQFIYSYNLDWFLSFCNVHCYFLYAYWHGIKMQRLILLSLFWIAVKLNIDINREILQTPFVKCYICNFLFSFINAIRFCYSISFAMFRGNNLLQIFLIYVFRIFFQKNRSVGDQFMNMLQPLIANVPYMTCPGNHESAQYVYIRTAFFFHYFFLILENLMLNPYPICVTKFYSCLNLVYSEVKR